jgi:hypothetical protein
MGDEFWFEENVGFREVILVTKNPQNRMGHYLGREQSEILPAVIFHNQSNKSIGPAGEGGSEK